MSIGFPIFSHTFLFSTLPIIFIILPLLPFATLFPMWSLFFSSLLRSYPHSAHRTGCCTDDVCHVACCSSLKQESPSASCVMYEPLGAHSKLRIPALGLLSCFSTLFFSFVFILFLRYFKMFCLFSPDLFYSIVSFASSLSSCHLVLNA